MEFYFNDDSCLKMYGSVHVSADENQRVLQCWSVTVRMYVCETVGLLYSVYNIYITVQ
jgi:hypothetical protein